MGTETSRKIPALSWMVIGLALAAALVSSEVGFGQTKVVDIEVAALPEAGSLSTPAIDSLVKIQGQAGHCQDGLYLVTHVGSGDGLFDEQNRITMENPWREQTWRYCSVFAIGFGDDVLLGRNWDNQNVGSIVISRYRPADGYASVSLSRAIDMGFPMNLDLEQLAGSDLADKLVLAPFYAVEGINVAGLTVAVAGVKEVKHDPERQGERVFVSYLVRKILDRARSVDEAVALAKRYIPFDLDRNSLNTHFLMADASGKSVILEYDQDQWRVIPGKGSWQIMTNKVVFDVPDRVLADRCWRFGAITDALEKAEGKISWTTAMKTLQRVAQDGTTWSTVYLPSEQQLYLSVYKNWDVAYRLKVP